MRTNLWRQIFAPYRTFAFQDDANALDLPTIKAWAMIIRLTIAEYLGLDPKLLSSVGQVAKMAVEDRAAKTELVSGLLMSSKSVTDTDHKLSDLRCAFTNGPV